jgi:DNA-binding NtrC family response regulator
MSARLRAPKSSETTETMHTYGAAEGARSDEAPGLVLLYAAELEELRPAYPLRAREHVIGRAPGADIFLPVKAVSRQHAVLFPSGGRWVLRDLGGRNGTIVNGEFVTEATLSHLDVVRIGDAIFKFVARDADGYARHRIDGAVVDPASGEARFPGTSGRIVGGYQIQRIVSQLGAVARSNLSVMILGESGTGKEVFARHLHDASGRRGAFQAVNCAAIPATLIEGELFGHRRGAFSGADRDRPGLVRAADGGTLFLDEIGDMPLEAQVKLLRVLQTKEVVPLGESKAEQVDVRVLCATHRDVNALLASGQFRGDLFARLHELRVVLPPLRERKEDIYSLCVALAARHRQPDVEMALPFMVGVMHHDFPFNVRELEAIIKRWAAVDRGPVLGADDLSDEIRARMKGYGARRITPTHPLSLPEAPTPPSMAPPAAPASPALPAAAPRPYSRRVPSEQALREMLSKHEGNVAAVGRALGKDRAQVHRWMKRYGIDASGYR